MGLLTQWSALRAVFSLRGQQQGVLAVAAASAAAQAEHWQAGLATEVAALSDEIVMRRSFIRCFYAWSDLFVYGRLGAARLLHVVGSG